MKTYSKIFLQILKILQQNFGLLFQESCVSWSWIQIILMPKVDSVNESIMTFWLWSWFKVSLRRFFVILEIQLGAMMFSVIPIIKDILVQPACHECKCLIETLLTFYDLHLLVNGLLIFWILPRRLVFLRSLAVARTIDLMVVLCSSCFHGIWMQLVLLAPIWNIWCGCPNVHV